MPSFNPSLNVFERGMLLGLHAGDAMGVTLEFQPPVEDRDKWQKEMIGGGEFQFPVGVGSDDTDLMICLLRSISKNKKLDTEKLKAEFVNWFVKGPKDVGNTTKKAMKKLAEGSSVFESGVNDVGTNTNGSLMRAAPLALLAPFLLDAELKKIVNIQTASTHAHPECLKMDEILIFSLKKILYEKSSKKEIYDYALAELEIFDQNLKQSFLEIPTMEWSKVTNGGRAFETLKSAYWGFFHFDSFEDAVVHIINRGNDSDTTAAVLGALFGARIGESQIPMKWIQKLNYREEILSFTL